MQLLTDEQILATASAPPRRLLSDEDLLGNEVVLQVSPPPASQSSPKHQTTRLLSDNEILHTAPTGVRPPVYGADGKPISDAEYQEMFQRQPQIKAQTSLDRIGEAAGEGYMRTLAPDVSLGPSQETVERIASVPVVGDFLARQAKVGGAVADFAVRGLTAPFSAANEAIGQTAEEAGMSQGMAQRLKRDISGLTEAGLLVSGAAPYTPRVPKPSVSATPAAVETQAVTATARPVQASSATTRAGTIPEEMPSNVNLARIQAPEDVKAVISEVAEQHRGFPEARRGRLTFEDIRELAPLVGMTPEKLSSRGVGKRLGSAEEMFAARTLLAEQATNVRNLAKKAQGGSDAEKFAFSEELTRLVAIQEQVSGATAEAGRMLSQFRMNVKASKERVAEIIDAARTNGLDDVITKINALDDPAQVANFASQAFKAKTSDQLLELWINALLSGPQTHAVNVLSNTLVSAWAIPEAAVAAGISKVTGSGIRGREVLARAIGTVEGAKEGLRAALRGFRSEEQLFETGKIDVRRYQAIPSATFRKGKAPVNVGSVDVPLTGEIQVGGKQIRLPGRLLTAEDAFFKSVGYRQEINALAMRQALSEGRTGKALAQRYAELRANPTERMIELARQTATKQTFTNPLGRFGQGLQQMTRDIPALRVVVPFIRTPINIVKFALERSPLAPLSKEVRDNLKGTNGAVARDMQIAKIGMGSTIGTVAAYMAAEGQITGGGPKDHRERSLLYAQGWQPYSVKIGDSYYSYGRLEPLGMLLGAAADFSEISGRIEKSDERTIAGLIMASISRNLTSKTWLRGISEVIEAMQDPNRYGEQYLRNFASTLIPTGVAQYARTQDPYLREARTIIDKWKERLPGLRETLPKRRDVFGEPIKMSGGVGPDIISPIYQSAAKDDPVVAEMLRLGVLPSRSMRKIQNIDLGPEEYETYQTQSGQLTKAFLHKLITSPEWEQLPDDLKADALNDVMRKARDVGRVLTMQRHPDLMLRVTSEKSRKRGGSTSPVAQSAGQMVP